MRVSPRFVWAAAPGADGYRVALYRDGELVFERDVKATALKLPRSWTHAGHVHSLTQGTYRWVVWPLLSPGPNARKGRAIVSAIYKV